MVPVNTHPLAVSSVSAPGTFTFRRDSAGLGVPRDFGELRSISSDVAHHGQVNTEIERGVIGPSFAHRGANGNVNGNPNANPNVRGAAGREYTPGSRSVATFSRPNSDMRGNGMDGMERMNNGMNGMNNGMPNGAGNAAAQGGSPGGSPHGQWQRPESGSAGAPAPRNMDGGRTNAAPPASGGGGSPQGGGAPSHK